MTRPAAAPRERAGARAWRRAPRDGALIRSKAKRPHAATGEAVLEAGPIGGYHTRDPGHCHFTRGRRSARQSLRDGSRVPCCGVDLGKAPPLEWGTTWARSLGRDLNRPQEVTHGPQRRAMRRASGRFDERHSRWPPMVRVSAPRACDGEAGAASMPPIAACGRVFFVARTRASTTESTCCSLTFSSAGVGISFDPIATSGPALSRHAWAALSPCSFSAAHSSRSTW